MDDLPVAAAVSAQDRYFPELTCFGCGPKNFKGLQLKSFESDDDLVRADFVPWPEHDNGLGYLNGGVIATLLDCHSASVVPLEAIRLGLVPDGTLQFVTAGLDVRYLRPAPLTEQVELVARVVESDRSQMTIAAELVWDGKPRASATALWKRWRPRTGTPTVSH